MVNTTFCTVKWDANIAYCIGLLVTDGNLSKDGRHISLRSSDLELLKTFKNCLGLNCKILETFNSQYAKNRTYIVQLSNVLMYQRLLSLGLFPAKTYTIGQVNIPNKFFRDFLRGHLDGDGSIITYTDQYNRYKTQTYTNNRLCIYFISASKSHIQWIQAKILELLKVKGSLSFSKPQLTNRVPIWRVKYSKKASLVLIQLIYYAPNLPCLKRKQVLAQTALTAIMAEKRKKYTRLF